MLLLSLFNQSTQTQFYWLNKRLNRQLVENSTLLGAGVGGYGNNQVPSTSTGAPTHGVSQENLVSGISFDCSNKQTGPNRDSKG